MAKLPQEFKPNWYPFWSPRFWHGMRTGDYLRLLRRNRFAIQPRRIGLSLTVAAMSVFNSVWSTAQRLALGKRIEATKIEAPPIFIVGHWRTGTTYLHELMTCDPQFAFPSNYDCFVPHHFVISKRLFAPLLNWFLPSRRPMDDMLVGESLPQEDEFALTALGAPTPYYRVAFPNHEPVDLDMLNLDTAPADKVARFREALEYFFKSLTLYYGGRRLILKSPPHTGRIRLLAELFPGSKFIHLSRNPYEVFSSTMRLWRSLDQVQGFQIPRYSDAQLEEFVLAALQRMYDGYFRQRNAIPSQDLVELKYEELVATPTDILQQVYEQLALGTMPRDARRGVSEYHNERKGHRPRSSGLATDQEQRVRGQWAEYFDAFGYASWPNPAAATRTTTQADPLPLRGQ